MRAGIGIVLALAAMVPGCRTLGLYEETARDMSDKNSRAGQYALNEGTSKIKIVKFDPDFKTAPGSVKIELLNEGGPQDFIAFDVEFGYPAPADAIAPYIPEFIEQPFLDWKTGESRSVTVQGAPGARRPPVFARFMSSTGTDVRRTAARETSSAGLRKGTMFLSGKVEVVKMEADLVPPGGAKATMAFTLENVSEAGGEVGNLRYMVQFYKDGKPMDLGRALRIFKAAPKPLGKKGDQVVVEVSLDQVPGLATAQPALRVTQ